MATARAQKAGTVAAVTARITGKTIGHLTDTLFENREKRRELQSKIDVLEGEYKALEEQLLEKLDSEGSDKGSGKKATCSVTTVTVADVQDWDALNAFIKKTGYFHLYQRRVSDPAFRELAGQKGGVPGVAPFSKKKLNIRTV